MDHASWMRHHRKEPIAEDTSHTGNNLNAFRLLVDMDDVMEEASGGRHHVGIIKEEASGGHPVGGHHLGFIWGVIWEAFWQTWALRVSPRSSEGSEPQNVMSLD